MLVRFAISGGSGYSLCQIRVRLLLKHSGWGGRCVYLHLSGRIHMFNKSFFPNRSMLVYVLNFEHYTL